MYWEIWGRCLLRPGLQLCGGTSTGRELYQAGGTPASNRLIVQVDDVLLRKDVDLVFIICQPDLHAQIAVKALGIGKHVLCDRPAGLCQVRGRLGLSWTLGGFCVPQLLYHLILMWLQS